MDHLQDIEAEIQALMDDLVSGSVSAAAGMPLEPAGGPEPMASPAPADAAPADGTPGHQRAWIELPEDWSCPGCGMTKPQVLEDSGSLLDGVRRHLVHDHHDHIADGMDVLIRYGVPEAMVADLKARLRGFPNTTVCHRCNAAESGKLKQHAVRDWAPELAEVLARRW